MFFVRMERDKTVFTKKTPKSASGGNPSDPIAELAGEAWKSTPIGFLEQYARDRNRGMTRGAVVLTRSHSLRMHPEPASTGSDGAFSAALRASNHN